MAFSTLLRSPVRPMMFSQQLMKLATQSVLKPTVTCPAASVITFKNSMLKAENTSLVNSVRLFKTSPIRLSEEKAHDHAKLWVVEKATSALLVPLIPVALLMPNKLFDSLVAILITAHSFWGLEAIVVEYARVILVGPTIPKIAMGIVYVLTVLMLGGLFFLIFNDIGMCRAFWRIWSNMRRPRRT